VCARSHWEEELDSGAPTLTVAPPPWLLPAAGGSLPARLAIEHCTHEARGLDVLPQTIARFRNNGDAETADLLERAILPEEVTHCAAGVRWLRYLHDQATACGTGDSNPVAPGGAPGDGEGGSAGGGAAAAEGAGEPAWEADARQHAAVELWFHALVLRFFDGKPKPPFNEAAREQAGFTREWWLPIAAAAPARRQAGEAC
jgi:hypothetical protein